MGKHWKVILFFLFLSQFSLPTYALFGWGKHKHEKEGEEVYHGVWSDHPTIDTLLLYAYEHVGCRYRGGGTGPRAFDCSGFTMYCYSHVGINLDHNSAAQTKYGEKVDMKDLQPGDLVFFNGSRRGGSRVGHVGIVSKVAQGEQSNSYCFIHASTSKGVREDRGDDPYFASRYVTARRLLGGEVQKKKAARKNQKEEEKEKEVPTIHVVEKGETLFSIAVHYGVTVQEIKKYNNLENSDIRVGDTLRLNMPIEEEKEQSEEKVEKEEEAKWEKSEQKQKMIEDNGKEDKKEVAQKVKEHKVKRGETLYGIARKYGMSVGEIKTLNKMSGNRIMPGERLKVKQ